MVAQSQNLKKSKDFQFIFRNGKRLVNKWVVLCSLHEEGGHNRVGLSVSRRVGNAVTRNLVKRRLREITKKIQFQNGWSIVLIARVPIVNANFYELSMAIHSLCNKAGICHTSNRPKGSI